MEEVREGRREGGGGNGGWEVSVCEGVVVWVTLENRYTSHLTTRGSQGQ